MGLQMAAASSSYVAATSSILVVLLLIIWTPPHVDAAHPPEIIRKPQNQGVRVGGVASFYCAARGDPPPSIVWRKNSKKVSGTQSRYTVLEQPGGISILRIEPVRAGRDDAPYECVAENGVGDAVSADATLTIYEVLILKIYQSECRGMCHYFSENEADYFDALFECQKRKLCLANFDNIESFKLLHKYVRRSRVDYWFGLNGYEKETFRYVSTNKAVAYLPEQTILNKRRPCGYLKPIGVHAYSVETEMCHYRKKFVCSEAIKCNGVETNSTFSTGYIVKPQCDGTKHVHYESFADHNE
ncbi:uncharacterized protein Dwil_GK27716 [Drosophila willistoni]|uniref:Ig-like domain-containing protein n=1 Tax=Drosophila willistoni TaxID=7260 RepID=A0A0Q9X296_DROWI|nr:uncharacterized protein Dwil_GK27716 [Drosophila willistoni]